MQTNIAFAKIRLLYDSLLVLEYAAFLTTLKLLASLLAIRAEARRYRDGF
jgi:hypothetical protein